MPDAPPPASPRRRWAALLTAAALAGLAGTAAVVRDPPGARAPHPGAVGTADAGCSRPFAPDSPWNTPIGPSPRLHPDSDAYVASLAASGDGVLTSDPTQYTLPVHYAGAGTPRRWVRYEDGWFSEVTDGGATLLAHRSPDPRRRRVLVPIPEGTEPAAGSDAQVVVIDVETGEEWDLSNVREQDGELRAWNVGRYHVGWSGVPPYAADGTPYGNRGPGIPYLAGLVRPCEIARGRIDHALAFAYPATTTEWVHPATRSDGEAAPGTGMPEGTRLQLDPAIGEAEIRSWGCEDACLTTARALQVHGMYLADHAGRPKLYFEYEGTARWDGRVTAATVSPIPLTRFRAVLPPG